jgi:hypothetical protein
MKIKIKNSRYLLQSCLVLLLLFIVAIPGENALAQKSKKSKKRKSTLEIKPKFGVSYDDNILKYSEKYLDRFIHRQDSGRFHIDTYDDAIFYTGLYAGLSFYVFKKRKTKISGEISRRNYTVNGIKSWNYMTFGLQQYFMKKASFKLFYSYIPDFYVRHFRDDQWIAIYGYSPVSFQPYSFAKNTYGAYVQNTFFKGTRVRLLLYYMQYYHNKHYTEYDSKNWLYGIELYQRLHKKVRLFASYQYITSDAKGYDASYQTPETTNGPDATYKEDRFYLGFLWKLPRIAKMNNSIEAKGLYFVRYYYSRHPWQLDRLHAGRVDNNLRIYVNYRIRVIKSLDIRAYYVWMGRNSTTSAPEINKIYISNEKDYHQNVFGLEFTYTFRFKI